MLHALYADQCLAVVALLPRNGPEVAATGAAADKLLGSLELVVHESRPVAEVRAFFSHVLDTDSVSRMRI